MTPAELKRTVGRALFGPANRAAIENTVIRAFQPKDGLSSLRVLDVSPGDLECVIEIKFKEQPTRYYKVKVSEVTT